MRTGAILSGLLHLALLLMIIFGLPALFAPEPFEQPIPVQLATMADIDKAKPAKPSTTPPKPQPKPQPPKPDVMKPEPPPPPAPALPPDPTPEPTPPPPPPKAPEPAPPAPQPPAPILAPPPPAPTPEPLPAPQPKPEPKPEPKLEPVPPVAQTEPLPVPSVKPKPPKAPDKPAQKPDKPQDTDFASVLKNLEKMKKPSPRTPQQPPAPQPPEQAPDEQTATLDQPLSMSELGAIRAQIEKCWDVPAGARDAENLIIEIHVELNPEGGVVHAEIVDRSRMGNSFYRAAAESALRAVMRCSPLQLPAKKYSVWKSVTLTFNPKEMFGT